MNLRSPLIFLFFLSLSCPENTPLPPSSREFPDFLQIKRAEVQGGTVILKFSHPIGEETVKKGILLLRLKDHTFGDPFRSSEEIFFSYRLENEKVSLPLPATEGTYLLFITPDLTDTQGHPLDGEGGEGEGNIYRFQDDWFSSPSPFRSLPITVGEVDRLYFSWGNYSHLTVGEIEEVYGDSGDTIRNKVRGKLYSRGKSKVFPIPPYKDNTSFRIRFFSPASHPYNLPSPLTVLKEVEVVDRNGFSLRTRLDLSANPKIVWVTPSPPRVVESYGETVTMTPLFSSPTPSGNYRFLSETVYLLAGNDPPPKGLLLTVENIDEFGKTVTVSYPPIPLYGRIAGESLLLTAPLYSGILKPGFSVKIPNGNEYPILSGEGKRYLLGGSPPDIECSPCEGVLRDLSPLLPPGTSLYFTSDTWYLHFIDPPPAGEPLFLLVNRSSSLRGIVENPFLDEERDGNEKTGKRDDLLPFSFSFRKMEKVILTSNRLQDGTFYPTLFQGGIYPCENTSSPFCVLTVPDPYCPGFPRKSRVSFSFVTADGSEENPFGKTDLLSSSFSPKWIQILSSSGIPVPASIETKTLFANTPYGIFPTTLITLTLLSREGKNCSSEEGLREFQDGDLLKIDHRISFLVPGESRTLDGNGNGVNEPQETDDLYAIYHPEKGFEIVSFPVSPP